MTGERFNDYVGEFRAFSKFHKVECGQPQDLLVLMKTVRSSDRFRAEMASMIRSMLYREREGLTQPELLRVVAVTWGGGDGANAPTEVGDFLREVLSRPAGEPLAIPVEEEPESREIAVEAAPVRERFAAAFERKAKEDSGERPLAKRDPWAEGSVLQRELAKFAEWRAGQSLRRAS